MSRAADRLGSSASFSHAQPVSARRAAIAAATEAETAGADRLHRAELPLAAISFHPDNPRETVTVHAGMVETVRSVGVVNAISVATVAAFLRERPERSAELDPGAQYVVVDGHRRLAAARKAGVPTIKAFVDDAQVSTDEAFLETAFIANAQRENLSDLEEAAALEKLVEYYGSQGKAAKRLGVTQPFISQRISLLKLDPALQADLVAGQRKVEHVRGLAKLPPEDQRREADARAARARSEGEEKAKRREPRETEPARAEPETHNAVMGSESSAASTGEGQTHNAVMGHDPKRTTKDDALASVPSARLAPVQPAEGTRPAAPDMRRVSELPWGDSRAIADVILAHLPGVEERKAVGLMVYHAD